MLDGGTGIQVPIERTLHVARHGLLLGTHTIDTLLEALRLGNVEPSDHYWMETMDEWLPVSSLVEQRRANLPPPPPPPLAPPPPPPTKRAASTRSAGTVKQLSDTIVKAAGLEKLEAFNISDFLSEVFKSHSETEVENGFAVGAAKTTPDLKDVDTSWPKPWLFVRLLLGALIVYWLLAWSWQRWQNPNLLPGLMLVGSFAVPVSMIVLFFECNVIQNVSLYRVVKSFFLGGAVAVVACSFLSDFSKVLGISSTLGPSVAGLTEEPAKLLAAILVLRKIPKLFTLNGLLVGASIGAGFAALESAGYAFMTFFQSFLKGLVLEGGTDPVALMKENIEIRGMLSPFAHIVWTAMVCAGLVRACEGHAFRCKALFNGKFLRPFGLAVILHILWNSKMASILPMHAGHLAIGIVGWTVVLAQIEAGLREARAEQHALSELGATESPRTL